MSAAVIHRSVVGAAWAVGAFLLWSPDAYAKTLYVDGNTGNDAVSWADNGPSTPWRTIGRAAWGNASRSSPNRSQAAQPGDTVVIAAGTYNSSLNTGQGRWDVLYNPVNSGTSSNPITFVADGTVALRAPSWGGPIVGARMVDHIVWRGPYLIDETFIDTEPDTGPVVFSATTGSGIDGARIHGNGAPWADNHVGIRFEPCSQCFVRNTVIDNFKSAQGSASRNGAAVMLYDSDDTIIENNEFFDCATGVYIKGTSLADPQERTIVRFNIIRDMLAFGVIIQESTASRVYQNLILNNPTAFLLSVSGSATFDRPINDVVANNTIDGGGSGVGIYYNNGTWDNVTFANNLWSHLRQAHVSDSLANPGDVSHIRALYYEVSGSFATFSGRNYGFANWQTAFNQDLANPASLLADPRFVDRSRGNYRLQTNSPARTLGVDILDLDGDGNATDTIPAGAYTSGNETIGTGAVRPAPPSGLLVN